jgi:putative acetyltransferase
MIRNWDANETGPLLELWLESTIHAHPFIAESYWHDSLAIVRDVYLPSAQTWVWEQDGVLKGFISVMESRFIGALFVAGCRQAGYRQRADRRSQNTTVG